MKIKENIQKIIISSLIVLVSTPSVWAYSVGIPIFDLWTILVEQVFGGFWLSTLFLMIIMGIIMVFGGVSSFTIMVYESVFLFAMLIGYGYNIVTIPLFVMLVSWAVYQFARYINSSSYA